MTEMRQKSHPEDSIRSPQQNGQQIDTGGGATVGGDASVGHDFIGRDRITIGQVVVVMGGSRQEVAVKSAPAEGESPYRGLEIFNVADA
ncbi:MAG: hypothetical protein ACK2UO_14755, partial [Caldilineaceae bacterium]